MNDIQNQSAPRNPAMLPRAWEDMSFDEQGDHLLSLLNGGRGNRAVGVIYYIACTDSGRLKIGFTTGSVKKRLAQLQTGSSSELRIIAERPGTIDDEAALHASFAKNWLRGEWFEMSEHIFDHICSVIWCAASIYAKRGATPPHWLRAGICMLEDTYGGLPPEYLAMT